MNETMRDTLVAVLRQIAAEMPKGPMHETMRQFTAEKPIQNKLQLVFGQLKAPPPMNPLEKILPFLDDFRRPEPAIFNY